MTVAAGVIGDPQGTAVVALIHMTSQLSGSADLNGTHGTQVPEEHFFTVDMPVGCPVGAKQIGSIERPFHGKDLFTEPVSKDLRKGRWGL